MYTTDPQYTLSSFISYSLFPHLPPDDALPYLNTSPLIPRSCAHSKEQEKSKFSVRGPVSPLSTPAFSWKELSAVMALRASEVGVWEWGGGPGLRTSPFLIWRLFLCTLDSSQ